jgi:hypothetical protein
MADSDQNPMRFSEMALTPDDVRTLLQHPQFEALAWEAQDNAEMENVVEFGIHLLAETKTR